MIRKAIATLLVGMMAGSPVYGVAQQQGGAAPAAPARPSAQAPLNTVQKAGESTFTMTVESNMVLTNVVVRDKKTGEVVKGLTEKDFTVLENNKPQRIDHVDFEDVDQAAALRESSTVTGKASIAQILNNDILGASKEELRDHRLIVMFFDISSMQPEDVDRAVDAAKDYVNKQMEAADLVACVSMSTSLALDQDFTSDKAALLRTIGKYNGSEGAGFAAGGDGTTDGTADDTSTFTADDTEFNTLNTDRELNAIQEIAKSLAHVDERKSMLYFSGGLTRNGVENQASLRAMTNAAVRANMAIYTQDARGLQALSPLGDASKGSQRGTGAFSGAAMQSQLNSNFSSQEVLATIAADTGGKSFFDSNDFGPAFQTIQHDTQAYYVVAFRPSNTKKDGSYRNLTIKVNRQDVNIEARKGYYAEADFQHAKNEDRQQMLMDQMRSDLPATDLQVYLQALYFRLSDGHFYVPVSVIVPGREIPFVKKGDKDKASIDILGQVKNAQGIIVGQAQQTVPLAVNESTNVQQKNVQYNTGFPLATGKYHMKFVVRENQTGQMGSFETDLVVPDMSKATMKLSSIVLSNQRVPNGRRSPNPLVRDGLEWVQNVPHVFRQDQHMYFLYEVYDPSHPGAAAAVPAPDGAAAKTAAAKTPVKTGPVRVLTSVQFMSGGVKVFETPLVVADAIDVPERNAVDFQFDVPLSKLKPGTYICQINVIDDIGGSFSFPRMAVVIRPPAAVAPVAPGSVPTAAVAKPTSTTM